MNKKYILDEQTANRKLQRMAYEIIENNLEDSSIILAGIRQNGSVIAARTRDLLKEICQIKVTLINISLDKKQPGKITLDAHPDFQNQTIIVIDDVANSGKTMLYALKPFLEFHPKKIQTLALVDRTHKAFPIKPDYIGLSLSTTIQEHIYVEVENNIVKGAWVE